MTLPQYIDCMARLAGCAYWMVDLEQTKPGNHLTFTFEWRDRPPYVIDVDRCWFNAKNKEQEDGYILLYVAFKLSRRLGTTHNLKEAAKAVNR